MLHLREVEFSDIFFALDAKMMLLKIYFDNGDEEPLNSLITSFKAFLKRNRLISDVMRKTYLNFISFLILLLKNGDEALEELRIQIKNSDLAGRSKVVVGKGGWKIKKAQITKDYLRSNVIMKLKGDNYFLTLDC